MLKFNEFIKESHDIVIDVDARNLEQNADQINAELDVLTAKPYQNAPILLTQLRGCLERYGVLIPASSTNHFLDLGAELVYVLGESSRHLYIVYDTNDDGFVDAYAQVVTDDELKDLLGMESSQLIDRTPFNIKMRKSTWYAPREDDGGNDDEY
jgi:hypothetical protein